MELCAEAATNAQADRRTSLRARRCGARTKSGKPCRSPATTKGRCRLAQAAAAVLQASGTGNTATVNGPRPRLLSGRNSAHCALA